MTNVPVRPPTLDHLFEPLTVGDFVIRNRLIMAPMTRNRSKYTVQRQVNADYYSQRATAGLIISEGTLIEPQGTEWTEAPGIWNDDHVAGWKLVTDAVHDAGGIIVCQLWHLGRVCHPYLQSGMPNVGPSPIAAKGGDFRLLDGRPAYVTPVAITDPEYYVAMYKNAAIKAKAAGFDGVELHSANGYLVHQFLDSTSNHRTDKWGGSAENRVRFLTRVVEELIDVWGAGRVGIKISPSGGYNDMGMDEASSWETYGRVVDEMNKRNIAFMDIERLVEWMDTTHRATPMDVVKLASRFKNIVFIGGDYEVLEAAADVAAGACHGVIFGRRFIANPDLVERIKNGIELEYDDHKTWYVYPDGKYEIGYSDYPFANSKLAPRRLPQ